jgi:CDP-paratose 2-epimerase
MSQRPFNVVVTGGGGFVGSHVAEFFANNGCTVSAVDNLSRSALLEADFDSSYNWEYLGKIKNVKRIKADVTDSTTLDGIIEGSDAVVHTAGQTAVTTSLVHPITDMRVNLIGTLNVLEAARRARSDPTVVFCSTNKVYGDNVNHISIKEGPHAYSLVDEPKGVPESFSIDRTGHTPYGCSKLAADIYVQDYAHTYGLKTVVFRMSCIYGTRQMGVEDQGWVAWFAIATALGKKITVYGDGKQVRDVLYVEDLVNAFDMAIQRSKALRGQVFNIGGGPKNTLSLLKLLQILERLSKKKPKVEFGKWRPHDQKIYVSDIRNAEKKLNWQPRIDPATGVRRLYEWVLKHENLFG